MFFIIVRKIAMNIAVGSMRHINIPNDVASGLEEVVEDYALLLVTSPGASIEQRV